MRLISFVVLMAAAACGPLDGSGDGGARDSGPMFDAGPPGQFSMRVLVKNDYAESIFTVRITYNGAESVLMDNQRIAGSGEAVAGRSLTVERGAPLSRTTLVTSLGTTRTFTGSGAVPSDGKSTLVYTYDYDLALAEFRLTSQWE